MGLQERHYWLVHSKSFKRKVKRGKKIISAKKISNEHTIYNIIKNERKRICLVFFSDFNRTRAEFYAFEMCQAPYISEEKNKDLWGLLSEKKKKRLRFEHTKRLKEYEEKLQAFKKTG